MSFIFVRHLTVDSIDDILSVALYFQEQNEDELIEMLKGFVAVSRHKTLVVQKKTFLEM
jgi:23S rRNA (cytosine1962-C5)-methyltransferase